VHRAGHTPKQSCGPLVLHAKLSSERDVVTNKAYVLTHERIRVLLNC